MKIFTKKLFFFLQIISYFWVRFFQSCDCQQINPTFFGQAHVWLNITLFLDANEEKLWNHFTELYRIIESALDFLAMKQKIKSILSHLPPHLAVKFSKYIKACLVKLSNLTPRWVGKCDKKRWFLGFTPLLLI